MSPLRFLANPRVDRNADYGAAEQRILSHARAREVGRDIGGWPGYRPTPLRNLNDLADHLGVGTIWYKDESERFGLGSFKALGGAYGVWQLLRREVRRRTSTSVVTTEDLIDGKFRDVTAQITVTCATDGNHGRSVAWGAKTFGCNSVIYLPAAVSENRESAIKRYGATIVRTRGNYDQAVRQVEEDARRLERYVVSDTAYSDYLDVPRSVMQAYTVMVGEVLRQLPTGTSPTHMFLQAGVGGMAAAVSAHWWEQLGPARPVTVLVEPHAAACLFASAEAGTPTRVEGAHETVMACLAAGEVSVLAWEILDRAADAFITISDEVAVSAMRLLARATGESRGVVAGEAGAAGLAGLMATMGDPAVASRLQLGRDSQVLLFGTEGATDSEIYARLVTDDQGRTGVG